MFVVKGRVFHRERVEDLCLGIEDGRIVAIRKVLKGDDVADHGDALILPGGIDLHVHLREPGLTDKEDIPSGTRSAALGGITTVLDMPNTEPPVTTRDALDAKIARIRGRANVDVGLYAAPRSGGAVARLEAATAFKVYMAETTGGLAIDDDALADVLEAAGETAKFVAVHAEDPRAFGKKAATDLRGHHAARPKEAEVGALKKLGAMRAAAKIHIAHVTCVEALDAVPKGATTEATPHHLFLDHGRPLRAFGKVTPPLRPPEDRDALWKAFVDGRIDVVASDHAPHTREEKEEGPFAEAPSGVPGVGTLFSAVAVGGARVSPQVFWVIGVSAAMVVLLTLFFQATPLGRQMRACALNRDAARLCGINARNMVTLSFMISAGIGALAGCVISPITYVQYDSGTGLAIKGFTAAILGGLGSSAGAVAGGLVLGLLEAGSIWVLPAAYKDAVAIAVLLAVLFVRPSGILGNVEATRLKEF